MTGSIGGIERERERERNWRSGGQKKKVGWGVARGEEDLVGFKKGRGVGEVIENYSFGVMDLFRWYEVARI